MTNPALITLWRIRRDELSRRGPAPLVRQYPPRHVDELMAEGLLEATDAGVAAVTEPGVSILETALELAAAAGLRPNEAKAATARKTRHYTHGPHEPYDARHAR